MTDSYPRPDGRPGWCLTLDDTERNYLLAGLDFARRFLGGKGNGLTTGVIGSTVYPHAPGHYQARLDLIEQAVAFPLTSPPPDR
jgi:hypothetical protein